jgi:hypothetical protein
MTTALICLFQRSVVLKNFLTLQAQRRRGTQRERENKWLKVMFSLRLCTSAPLRLFFYFRAISCMNILDENIPEHQRQKLKNVLVKKLESPPHQSVSFSDPLYSSADIG